MIRSWASTAGTVEQADTPSLSVSCSSARYVRASASAVSRASVFTRQDSTSFGPSKTPSTVFVLPMSIVSSPALVLPQVEGDVEDLGRVGQRADRDVVDAGGGDGL